MLVLEDGRVFRGRAVGATEDAVGEVVFNTAMTGYQEVLTDPSYRGQIVVMTYPHIGNYGVNPSDRESDRPQVSGFVVREMTPVPSSWRAGQSLPDYLKEHRITCISEVDTRALTRHIRTRGAMRGVISSRIRDAEELARMAREAPFLADQDLVGQVTSKTTRRWETPRETRWTAGPLPVRSERRPRCVAVDFGAKQNILRLLKEAGFEVTVVPAQTGADEILALKPDGVFLSNGPGDPEVVESGIQTVRALIGKVPVFGICLGHQIAALALGAKTFKLKFGHRGANHPVKDLRTGKVAVTSQNHGYAVDTDSLPRGTEVTHVNLNDGTCEGFFDPTNRVRAVQYHPESSPGPHDSLDLFLEFRELVVGGDASAPAGATEETK